MSVEITAPQPGWYLPDERLAKKAGGPRWVLMAQNEHVIFSVGSKRTKECTYEQFTDWCRKYGAERATQA